MAAEVLVRIEDEGAYANLVLPHVLATSGLDERDRGFVTELVYGTTRMRRACDWLVARFLVHDPDALGRALLRVGAYQLAFLDTPPHAAVSATVAASPKRLRGLVNAVLRKVAAADRSWPDAATRLSYPDWILDRLAADLGPGEATAALEAMDGAAEVHRRPDGYVQDRASTWVAEEVGATAGERVLDLCAAPGGKATALAATGATVVAADVRRSRLDLVVANARSLGADHLSVVQADGRAAPFADGAFDRVLVDAPCSGLGALRRRPDARWRIAPDDVDALAALQRSLVAEATRLVRPGGVLVYSACTMTRAETEGVDEAVAADDRLVAEPLALTHWRPWGRGGLVLPQDAGTDGMFVLRLRRR